MSERMAARSWQGGGAPRTGGAQANDNEARCDVGSREPGIPIRASSWGQDSGQTWQVYQLSYG